MSMVLDPGSTFDRFVVGPENRLAAAAARRTAQAPGTSYNPLFIYGASGLGKTHLLMAIAHLAVEVQPDLKAHYEILETFIDRLTAAIAEGTLDEFREAVSQADLLLLDDVHHLAAKPRTQEELVRLWESLIPRGTQVVLASDRPPHEITELDERLASRLSGGLIVDIAPPEPPTRLAILRQAAETQGVDLSDEVMEAPAPTGENEFDSFLSDITSTLEEVVEAAPWRRVLGEAILRWEGVGIRTRRLEEALDADSAPDVDALVASFSRDSERLREIERELRARDPEDFDPEVFRDPDRLDEAEALLAASRPEPEPHPSPAIEPAPVDPASGEGERRMDQWFYNREKIAWSWDGLTDRLMEEPG
jgi:hypothetical protein